MITEFGKATIKDRYLQDHETIPEEMFLRVANYYSNDDEELAARLYNYMNKGWWMPSTPILSNGGTDRGLPISCFLNEIQDSLESILDTARENGFLAGYGGGIGTSFSKIRELNSTVSDRGESSGVVPFLQMMNAQTQAISQGTLRRGSAAAYMNIDHPEIEEFIDIRRPTGGDPLRKAPDIHHGVCVSDDFMKCVRDDLPWRLFSPKNTDIVKTVKARDLWTKILLARVETGEPYLLFTDTVQRAQPVHHRELGLPVTQSNLCAEIMLPTNEQRTAVCCLSSLNVEYFDDWKDNDKIIPDVLEFLKNVLSDFVEKAKGLPGFEKAVYSAENDRSVGLGVMGLHSFFMSKGIPFDSVMATVWNKKIFKHINDIVFQINNLMGRKYGKAPDIHTWHQYGTQVGYNLGYFSHVMAVAPTASISIICGETSPGIEPVQAVVYTQKTLSGSFTVKNKYFQELLENHYYYDITPEPNQDWAAFEYWASKQWQSILDHSGSVQHLEWLSQDDKDTFKTAFEIDQRAIIDMAADRAPMIDQGQSVNIFLPANVNKRDLHFLHFTAWQKGVKSLYYCRSKSVQRASNKAAVLAVSGESTEIDYEECLSCQ